MTATPRLLLAAAVALTAVAAAPRQAAAAPRQAAAEPALQADVEVDPTAYVLRGYSLHVGLAHRRLRVDLGAFAMALPTAVHGNDDFSVSFDGFGAKLQYFVLADQRGPFVGVDAAVARMLVERDGSDEAARDTQVNLGVNLGWRFELGDRLYATPWLGVGYALSAEDVMLGGSSFDNQRVTVFPAVHLGYRFE